MKRLLSFITLVVVAMYCYADQKTYVVDGFKYMADPDTKEATLIYNGNKYSDDVVIPASFMADSIKFKVTALGEGCFKFCDFKTVTIPLGVTTIGDACFYGCIYLTNISIPSSVTSIGQNCFFECNKLTSIILPASLKTIGSFCFGYCTALSSITCLGTTPPTISTDYRDASFGGFYPSTCILYVPDVDTYKAATAWKDFPHIYKIKDGDDQKIYYVDGLKYLVDPDTKKAMLIYNENRYKGDVTIPASFTADSIEFKVTALGARCFYESNIKSVSIPEGVNSLGEECFKFCAYLKNIIIPLGVTSIGDACFYYCLSLTSVSIPSSVTNIGDLCFLYCCALTNITIPFGVSSLGYECFAYNNITSISIPSSVISLGSYCFYNCSKLTSIILPSSVKTIDDTCFEYCKSLSTITSLAPIPPTVSSSFCHFSPSTCILYVPDVDAYKAATAWKDFTYIYKIKDGDDQSSDSLKCEKPIISFASGKLLFSDATKGAEYHYTLKCADVKTNEAIENGIVDLAACYDIEVYATADGYSASDNANATLYWVKDDGKIGTDINNAKTRGLVVSSDQGLVTCSGLNDGEQALFYSTEGKLLGRQTAQGGSAGIATQEKFVILKVGATSMKVRMNQ